MKSARLFALAAGLLTLSVTAGHAGLQVIGDGITGDYNVSNGTSLWSLVQNVQTPALPGHDNKNAILHNYVVGRTASGGVSVFSAGELDPSFGGTGGAPYVSVNGGKYGLVDPNAGAAGRDLSNVTSLTVIAIPALPSGPGGASSSFGLSGLVTDPGTYTAADLPSPPPASVTVQGSAYEGEPLYAFLNPLTAAIATSDIVVTGATDGYLVVFSLAELDPALGGTSASLLVYAGATFPGAALARIVTPYDNKHGRWNSNIDFIDVAAVPEASTWALMLLGFSVIGLAARRAGGSLRAA
jgi:hypothetical protein